MTTPRGELFDDPYALLLYGPSGAGKTGAGAFAFPDAYGIGDEKGFVVASHFLSFQLDHYKGELGPVQTIYDLVRAIEFFAKRGRRRFIVDDFTMLLKRTLTKIETGFGGWGIWRELTRILLELNGLIEVMRLSVVFTMWYDPPGLKDGVRLQGRPQTPSKEATVITVGVMSSVFGFYEDPNRTRSKWQWTMTGQATTDRTAKDRYHACGTNYPPSVRSVLRAAGQRVLGPDGFFVLPDPPGIPSLDSFVVRVGVPGIMGRREKYDTETISGFAPGQLLTDTDQEDFVREAFGKLRDKLPSISRNGAQAVVRESLYAAEHAIRQREAMIDDLLFKPIKVTGAMDPTDVIGNLLMEAAADKKKSDEEKAAEAKAAEAKKLEERKAAEAAVRGGGFGGGK